MFKITFSDNRSITVEANSEAEAKRKAYRFEPAYTVIRVDSL